MKCQRISEYDDMYPEFAPEPIVVPCEAEATHFVVYESHIPGDDEPLTVSVLCQQHHDEEVAEDTPWESVLVHGTLPVATTPTRNGRAPGRIAGEHITYVGGA